MSAMAGRNRSRCSPPVIELGGREVRSRDERDAPPEQGLEQRPEDHGVGHVAHHELVDAQDAGDRRDVVRDPFERRRPVAVAPAGVRARPA